jgi:hypothetical protein
MTGSFNLSAIEKFLITPLYKTKNLSFEHVSRHFECKSQRDFSSLSILVEVKIQRQYCLSVNEETNFLDAFMNFQHIRQKDKLSIKDKM